MALIIIHAAPALLILLACLVVFLWKKKHRFWSYFLLGWALQILLSLPAGIWQSLKGWPHIDVSGMSIWHHFTIPLVGWPFNAGGFTVRSFFEATVEPLEWLVGHRSATVLSNIPYFWFLLLVQGSIFAAIFAILYKKQKTFKYYYIACLGALFLTNSLLNVTWFWAGT